MVILLIASYLVHSDFKISPNGLQRWMQHMRAAIEEVITEPPVSALVLVLVHVLVRELVFVPLLVHVLVRMLVLERVLVPILMLVCFCLCS